mmetsp:Transcript_89001/g.260114  ORF Transcript_89001/g.260114 Transcript_89001/m.260114 type:complete len:235 (+) Transcript_89001:1657-2361(+)
MRLPPLVVLLVVPLRAAAAAEVLDSTGLAEVLSGEFRGVLLLQIVQLLFQSDGLLHVHLAHAQRLLRHALGGLDELRVAGLHLLGPLLRVRRHADHLAASAPGPALGPLPLDVGVAVARDDLEVVEEVLLVLCAVPACLVVRLELVPHDLRVDLVAGSQLSLGGGEPIVRAEANEEVLTDTPVGKVRLPLCAPSRNLGVAVGAHEGVQQRSRLLHLLLSAAAARSAVSACARPQ